MTPVKNIIFDLGNVLYDIDFNNMYAQFDVLGIPNFENHFTLNKCDQLFYDVEKGFIDQVGFCEGFNQLYNLSLSHTQIISAWNSLLVGFRKESMDWIKANQGKFPMFLYSNTNQIHCDYVLPQYEREIGGDFEKLFKKPYYSHHMGMRKPDPASFQYILDQEGLNAAETLFIDDNEPNVIGAASVGLQVLYLQPGMFIETELPKILGQKPIL
jgi:HAD superfamily hydrolase (TIGR01549 family)